MRHLATMRGPFKGWNVAKRDAFIFALLAVVGTYRHPSLFGATDSPRDFFKAPVLVEVAGRYPHQ
jgi:hypothetical protein